VFNVDLLQGAQAWPFYHDDPNHRSFDLAVVEFHDSGAQLDKTQINAAEECVRQARSRNKNGAVVVVFIHGWHHSARWDIANNEGDEHFRAFRNVLASLTLRESERYDTSGSRGRRVVGIYLAWNGDPAGSWLSWLRRTKWLTHLSFRDRYRTAKRIGENQDILDVFRSIVTATKTPMDQKPESPLILIGHSMGALMLESAFLALLVTKGEPLVVKEPQKREGCVEVLQNGEPISFPDVLIALNSAADSRIAKSIKAELEKQQLTKRLSAGNISYAPPVFMSLTSSADSDTKIAWRVAQFPRFWLSTAGHDHSLFTHALRREKMNVSCDQLDKARDFEQNWHCLRVPSPPDKPTPSISIDLPTREREGRTDKPTHDRYTLAPLRNSECSYTSWVFQVPPEIVSDHNDIFNSRAGSLILALIQISGAVMGLAPDLENNFEKE
jgi:pimeloyl-ACP methyl ester carboxylesterase